MVRIFRRSLLRLLGVTALSGLGGCNVTIGPNGERHPTLKVHPEVERTETAWQMDVWVRNTRNNTTSIHDVTVIAFTEHGDEACRLDIGDFPQGGRFEERDTLICDDFPAIVTATAEESPCDGANIRIAYLARVEDERERFVWDSTFRECDESLPPDRVIEQVAEPPNSA